MGVGESCCGSATLQSYERLSTLQVVDADELVEGWVDGVRHCKLEQLYYLLVDDSTLLESPVTLDGRRALHAMAEKNDVEGIQWLVARGAKLNSRHPPTGDTALHIAARREARNAIQVLISAGADVKARNKNRKTPAEVCKRSSKALFKAANVKLLLEAYEAIDERKEDEVKVIYVSTPTGFQREIETRKARDKSKKCDEEYFYFKKAQTAFGHAVGCELDAMAVRLRRLPKSTKLKWWCKFTALTVDIDDANDFDTEMKKIESELPVISKPRVFNKLLQAVCRSLAEKTLGTSAFSIPRESMRSLQSALKAKFTPSMPRSMARMQWLEKFDDISDTLSPDIATEDAILNDKSDKALKQLALSTRFTLTFHHFAYGFHEAFFHVHDEFHEEWVESNERQRMETMRAKTARIALLQQASVGSEDSLSLSASRRRRDARGPHY